MILVSLIAAVADNGIIGNGEATGQHSLPWKIKSEFQYFKKTTMGKPLIFGRKTLEALGQPLPGRLNIIVTRDKHYKFTGGVVAHTVEDAIKIAKVAAEKENLAEIFVGGGAEIYKQALPLADKIYLTEVHMNAEGDTHFPAFDRKGWVETKREPHKKKEGESADYTITVLERKA